MIYLLMKTIINNLSRSNKILILILIDIILISLSIILSFFLKLDNYTVVSNINTLILFIILVTPVSIAALFFSNFYISINRYGSLSIFKPILLGSTIGSIFLTLIIYFGNINFLISTNNESTNVIRSIPIIFLLIQVFFLLLSRFSIQTILDNLFTNEDLYPIAVYSYSKNLLKLASFLEDNFNLQIKYFLSDSKVFINSYIKKIPVIDLASYNEIQRADLKYIIVVDLPSNIDERSKILDKLSSFNTTIKFLNFNQTNKINFENKLFEDIDIDLLLSREKVIINYSIISAFFKDKIILVTGGGGSIGSELCFQLLKFNIKKLIIVDISEYNLYEIKNRINDLNLKNINVTYKLLDICKVSLLNKIFLNDQIDIVYHASAYKHVVFGGENFVNFFYNNLISTKNLLDCATKNNVKNFMLVSTDKASNPSNIMGLTKLLSEKLCDIYKNSNSNIIINKVRFGNVLGTSGSVIPLFKKQILNGGPVTVSHSDVTRYFMTKDEAVELILYASKLGKSNELFFLDMGKPIKIIEIAKKMINLLGRKIENPENKNSNDVKIIYKGLEPGEKLSEIVHVGNLDHTEHTRIFISNEKYDLNDFKEKLDIILNCIDKDSSELNRVIKTNFPNIRDI